MGVRIGKLTLCVFIDALGWRLLQGRPWLEDVLPHRYALETVFGYSSACDPTILTGAMPEAHGHFAFYTYDPARSPFRRLGALRHLPDKLAGRGRVRHLLSRLLAPALGMRGYFQLYNAPFDALPLLDYTERRDLYRPGGINGGQPTILDRLRDAGVDAHVSNWRDGDAVNIAAAVEAIRQSRPSFVYLFLGRLDAVIHAAGTQARAVDEQLAWYEQRLRGLVELAHRQYREVQVLLFSDHGMADVTDECDLTSRIETLPLRFGVDYAAVYDSTMARFWFLRPEAREPILRALQQEPLGRVVERDELAEWGCDFPDQRYGELFFLLHSGVLLNPSFMGRTRLAGMHGYDPRHPDSTACFASNVVPARVPRRLDDLFTVMSDSVFGPLARPHAA